MSRDLTAALKQAIYSSSTEEAFLVLLEITHASLSEPVRVTSDAVATTHDSNTYNPLRFKIALPDDDPDKFPTTTLEISNVDRRVVEAIRKITDAADVTMKVVLGSAPDTVEAGPITMKLRNVRYDQLNVSGDLESSDFSVEPFPAHTYNPVDYPFLRSA